MADLQLAADTQCHICVRVYETLERKNITLPQNPPGQGSAAPLFKYYIHGTGYDGENINRIYLRIRPLIKRARVDVPFLLFPSTAFPGPLHSAESEIPPFTGDPAVAQLVRSWLNVCLNSHVRCNRFRDPNWFPSRLLDLRLEKPRLLLTSMEKPAGSYATLSHCWGANPEFLTLTSSNMQEMCAGVALDKLPKNFIDAILITKRLGLDYLWVDSLCIIQSGEGSHEDWLKEATAMSSVYTNGVVNIAATRASSSTDGLFTVRNPTLHRRASARGRLEGQYHEWTICYEEMEDRDIWESPLMLRGWVMQERLLAARMLHFSSGQIWWECTEKKCSETFTLGWPTLVDESYYGKPQFNCLEKASLMEETWDTWREIVLHFTSCGLTYPNKDKFVALSAVAKRMSAILDDQYVAGFFRRSLLRDLLWDAPQHSRRAISTYRAPSWSWASIDGPIDFYTNLGKETDSIADLISVMVEYIDESNPYGQVRYAEIKLRGRLIKISSVTSTVHIEHDSGASQYWGALPSGPLAIICDFDDARDRETGISEVTGIIVERTYHEAHVAGLLLCREDKSDRYKRIGVFTSEGLDRGGLDRDCDTYLTEIINGMKEETVTIV